MILAGFIGCLFLLWVSWDIRRDILAPPVVLSAVWVVVYFILYCRSSVIDMTSPYYLSFFASLACFNVGFHLFTDYKGKRRDYAIKSQYSFRFRKWQVTLIVLVILMLFAVLGQKLYVLLTQHYVINPWQTLTHAKHAEIFTMEGLLSYGQNMIIAFMAVSAAVVMQNPSYRNVRIFVTMFLVTFVFAFAVGNRGSFFLIFISIFFLYLFVNNLSPTKVKRMIILMAIIMLSIFVVTSYWKFVYEDQSDDKLFLLNMFRTYFSLSPIAFVEWINSEHELLMGSNTFRFFFALLSDFGFDFHVEEIKQEYTQILDEKTNVYTVLHYTASDFGLVYALVMQFIIGSVYGILYKKSFLRENGSLFAKVLLALLYFPLINQFFDDKYFSITSTWIQLTFWTCFFVKFFVRKEEKTIITE